MDALTQAYSGMQQYTASALPSLYGQSLLQQSAAGSQKEGEQLPSLLATFATTTTTTTKVFLNLFLLWFFFFLDPSL